MNEQQAEELGSKLRVTRLGDCRGAIDYEPKPKTMESG
jgi:hypothetical protein